ncbi:MAG: hypothetical protein C0596_17550 [Marinilabiliales bacterium]|nr:MAG: hypothetical protein C0596_17550 [Marinilabiliales bacterium]
MKKKYYFILAVLLFSTQFLMAQSYQFTKVADLMYPNGVVFNSNNEMFYFSQGDNLYDETGTNLLGSTGIDNVSIGVENDIIWVGGYWGATKYQAGIITTYPSTAFPAGGGVYDIDYFQNNVYLAKEEGGLCYFDGIDWHENITSGLTSMTFATCVTHDDNGNLYVGGTDGSYLGLVDVFDGSSWTSFTNAEHGVGWLTNILIDSNDNIWVVGDAISMFDGSTWTQYGAFAGNVNAIEEDAEGNIWIASAYTTNIYKYDGSTFDLITTPQNCNGRTNGFALNQYGELFVTLEDGVYRIEELDGNSITTYSFPEQTAPAVIDPINYTIEIEVINGTDLTNLVADFTISVGATATVGGTPQISGTTPNDFTNPVTYTVESGTGTPQDWTITVTDALLLNDENDILSFNIPGQVWGATINSINHTVELNVPDGTNLTSLAATFTLSEDAVAYVGGTLQESGVTTNDFTNTVTYSIHAENGDIQNWFVSTSEESALSSENDIILFSFPEQTGEAIINNTNQTVVIEVANGTDLTNLIASYTISPQSEAYVDGTLQESGVTVNDFSSPVIYSVHAEDSDIQNWTITVTEGLVGINTSSETEFIIYPNPASDYILINSEVEVHSIAIYSVVGEIVSKTDDNSGKIINISNLSSGSYLLILTSKTGNTYTTKFIKD